MSRSHVIASLTIALAVVGSACSTGGSETPDQQATPVVAAEPAPVEDAAESPTEAVPTMANGEEYDSAYVAGLFERIDGAATLDDYFAAMSAFVVYMDSAPVDEATTSTWEVDEHVYDDLATQFGITVAEAQAAIAAHPVLGPMVAGADFVSSADATVADEDLAAEPTEEDELDEFVDEQIEWSDDDTWDDHEWTDDEWTDDEWADDEWLADDPFFVDPALADLIGPWGEFGDRSCAGSSVAHIESGWESFGAGSGSGDGILVDAHADLVGGFAGVDDASEVMSVLGVCEAARQAEQLNAALGFPGLVSDLTLVTDDLGDVWALRVYQDVVSDTVVVFVQEFEQIVIYVSVGQDEFTAVAEAYASLGW